MGLATELSYIYRRPNPLQRSVQALASKRPGAWFFSKTGQPRRTQLIALPLDDTLALLGTNFGQPKTPTWVLNLEAEPRASVDHRGITRDVVARPATEAERAEVMTNSAAVYGGYLKYQQRIPGRRVRMFVLEHTTSDEGTDRAEGPGDV